ncbi:MAG: FAD binding domain-containing protein [Flavisolibacter sp.]|jgi:xanthine dehydrogenase small subunit|nr:FAD binding domain-containing protein [Flavisolibacter sp.]
MISFILNNQSVETALPPGSTVLDFVRYHKNLKGTKIGCREGDCGACNILVGGFENDKLVYRSMTSCLMPLGNAHVKHIVTVEGINLSPTKTSLPQLSPVQKAMVDTNGTQCGFCTIGFIMSFTGFTFQQTKKYEDAIAAIDGNICRCTGYKSIERAAKLIIEKIKDKPAKDIIAWLTDNGFLPSYFKNIEQRLKDLKSKIAEPISVLHETSVEGVLGGGTDLIVQKPLAIKKSANELVFNRKDLKGVFEKEGVIYLGASVTVTDFAESPVIQQSFSELKQQIKYISSTAIRNMATIAGNFVNASPIGDMTVYFLALDASIVLNNNGKQRTIKLKDFYRGYKTIDKEKEEIIETILFSAQAKNTHFNFEKVSKRKYLDIASVNSAASITLNRNVISDIHLSAGGVAPFPKYLNATCNFLKGKTINDSTLREAMEILNSEISPISDARGSAGYKRLLLRQLFLAHFLKAYGPEPVQKILVP